MSGPMIDKVTLVTGAGSGIGRATSLAFAAQGARVVVVDLNEPAGQETVRLIEEAGGLASFITTDVGVEGEVEALVSTIVKRYGRLDIAHNNAGILGIGGGQTHEYPAEVWERVLKVNLTSVWLCLKYEIRQMLAQGGGAIVNTSSIMGLVGGGSAAYNAAKHGVIGLTQQAAVEYARQGIRVNAVCPGYIETPMLQTARSLRPGLDAGVLAQKPIGRFGRPEEIAAAVIWLCSEAASFVTGVALPVDGGWVAR